MTMFQLLLVYSLCVICVIVHYTDAQATCDTAGCENGECLVPPAVATPLCSCSPGYKKSTDPNVCIDINECSNYFQCGWRQASVYELTRYFNPITGYPPYWPFVPTGQCLNSIGSYKCWCSHPYYPTFNHTSCYRYPAYQQPNLYQTLSELSVLDSLDIIDM